MKKICFILLTLVNWLAAIGQINLQTGSAVFNVPIFSWQDNRSRLQTAVSLQYNSGYGVRVDEVPSSIGQGWGLLAGGVITRMQVGEPDDQKPQDGAFNFVNKYPAGYLYNPEASNAGCPQEMANYPLFGSANQLYKQHNSVVADRERDYFNFQVNGMVGTFVLEKNNGDRGVLLGDSKIKVWFQRDESQALFENCRTTISTFYIQDENGLIYTFSQRGKTKALKTHPSTPGNPFPTSQPTYQNGGVYYESAFDEIPLTQNPYITSSWHLTQIRDPLTGRQINFTYAVRNLNNADGDDIKHCNSNATIPDYVIVTHKVSITITPVLSFIIFPDGHNVAFNYDDAHPRVDLRGDVPMKSVDVTWYGRPVSSHQLTTSYFVLNNIRNPVTADERKKARLCLKSVQKIGVDLKEDEPPYVFDYYTGTGANGDFVPPPFYHFKDIWGYYNAGKTNDLLLNPGVTGTIPFNINNLTDLGFKRLRALCFIKDDGSTSTIPNVDYNTVNPGYAKNGLLKSITTPLGGVLNYEYSQNRFDQLITWDMVLTYGCGVNVSKITQTNGEQSFDGLSTTTTSYVYKNTDGTTSMWGTVMFPHNKLTSSYHYEPLGSHYVFLGGCKYDYTYVGILSREQYQNIANQSTSFLQVFSSVLTVAFYAYDLVMLIATGNPVGLIMDAIFIIIDIITACSEDYGQNGSNYMITNYNIYGRNNLPLQFKRVEAIAGDLSNNVGKTVFEFTSSDDYPIWLQWIQGVFLPEIEYFFPDDPFSMKQMGAVWGYGLPKKMTVWSNQGKKVKETESIYYWDSVKRQAGTELSCHCLVDQSVSMKSSDWMNLSNPQNLHYTTSSITYPVDQSGGTYVDWYRLKVDQYPLYTGRVQIKDSYERIYKQNDDSRYQETLTHFDYNANNYQVSKITTTQSNGDKAIKEMYYPGDYTNGGILQSLVTNNIISLPVATYSAIQKNGSSTINYLTALVTDYTSLTTGDIRPSKILSGRSTTPVTSFTFNPANPFNYPGLVETTNYSYDVAGNLSGVRDEGGHQITNIYDYEDKYLAAAIINADPAVDRSAYTSFETSSFGGWTLGGNAAYTASGVTGTNAFTFNSNTLTTSLNVNKPYRLSFWATSTVNIGGASTTLVTSGPVLNGFTYYEYEIPSGNSTVNISGSGNIDELRIYPKMARMRTATYDPLIGKTAECDENNRITYYEYDNLGRLRFIKDENRNILKMYEYNFKK